jgi:hypothetical protein
MSVMSVLHSPLVSQNGNSIHRFSVKQYQRMVEQGFLTDEDRVELLDGWIVDKMPRNPPHDGTISRISRRLTHVLSDDLIVRIQSAVQLPTSQPEPDLAIVRGPEEVYFQRHPLPRDVELLIEVADTTLDRDRTLKGPLYARSRIAVYWIVNLNDSIVEVYTRPRAGRTPAYRIRQDYAVGDFVPLLIAGKEVASIPVADLLPPFAGESE